MNKPVLLGMNNPISSAPEHALYPHPVGCSGWRLWAMLNERTNATKSQYLRAFDRRDLVPGKTWDKAEAKLRATVFREEMQGRVVVVLGEAVRVILGIPRLLIHPQEIDGVTWRQLPHPSGLNRWYRDPECRALACALLAELYATVEVKENA